MLDILYTIDSYCSPSVTHNSYSFPTRHLFSPVQRPVRMLRLPENHMRLPSLLSPVPRRRDEDTAAQKCAQLRARLGDTLTSRHSWPVSQRNGLEGNMAHFDTLCMSREMPCVVGRSALPSG